MDQPIGQDIHMPVTPRDADIMYDKITLKIKSVKVAIIKEAIAPAATKHTINHNA